MAEDLRALIDRVRGEARRLATREDGSVDAMVEASEFRRLMLEAAGESEDKSGPVGG